MLKQDPRTKVRFQLGEDPEIRTVSGPEYEELVGKGHDLNPKAFYVDGRWEDARIL